MNNIDTARSEMARSAGGGVGFLAAYGITLVMSGALAFVLPVNLAALLMVLQGVVALPATIALERLFGFPPLKPENPLRSLSMYLSFVQLLALPTIFLVYQRDPLYVPAVCASLGGAMVLPAAWLYRTRLYVLLAATVSLTPWVLMYLWGASAFPYVPLVWGGSYLVVALVLTGQLRERKASPVRRLAPGRAGRW